MIKLIPKTDIPCESLMGRTVTKPILSDEIMDMILEALVPITHKKQWEKMMAGTRRYGTKILLKGPPGCGKSTVAYWIAKRLENQMIIPMTMADIGGSEPGSGERAVREIFKAGASMKNATIFLDECDSLLWSREKAGADSMWMVGIINQLLLRIEEYKGVVILASNFDRILDPALNRRLDFILTIPPPSFVVRRELWREKLPLNYPVKLNENQLNEISKVKITGSIIETVISRTTRKALREGKHPTYEGLLTAAQILQAENRGESATD